MHKRVNRVNRVTQNIVGTMCVRRLVHSYISSIAPEWDSGITPETLRERTEYEVVSDQS